jgi:hypothetical protein
MIETSLKAKIPTEFDTGFFYCPYIPDVTLKSNYSWLDEVKESEDEE